MAIGPERRCCASSDQVFLGPRCYHVPVSESFTQTTRWVLDNWFGSAAAHRIVMAKVAAIGFFSDSRL